MNEQDDTADEIEAGGETAASVDDRADETPAEPADDRVDVAEPDDGDVEATGGSSEDADASAEAAESVEASAEPTEDEPAEDVAEPAEDASSEDQAAEDVAELEDASSEDTDSDAAAFPADDLEDGPLAGDDTEARPGLEKAPPFVLGLGALKSALESLIFVSDKPLTDRQLADMAHASVAEVRMAAFELQKDYEGRGIELHMVAGGYQFRSAAKNAPFVRALVAPKPVRLSRALLETLSIVAYRQPVTRPEVDDVRGVDSGEALKGLADRDLVRILGRKEEPGRPLLYGTTKHFLEFFGLNSLKDLPTLREYAELTDESRSIFERRMGEPLDLKSVQAKADAAIAEAHAEMLERGEDPNADPDDEDDEAPEGEAPAATTPEEEAPPDPDAEAGEASEDEE